MTAPALPRHRLPRTGPTARRMAPMLLLAAVLAGCTAGPFAVPATAPGAASAPASPAGADATPDILLIGETHDAAGQPDLVVAQLQQLAAQGRLAAVALEMAPLGATTIALPPDADDAALRRALRWDERAWPWARYAPVVRAGLAAGVPVVGANLPADQMRAAMEDVSLDVQLEPDVRRAQEEAIRTGHCGLLPERQIGPMTRVQIGRDKAMALTLAESVRPGRTAVLLAGAGHVDRQLGVPQHLPTQLTVRSVAMVAGGAQPGGQFDTVWTSPAMPPVDHCAALRQRMGPARRG